MIRRIRAGQTAAGPQAASAASPAPARDRRPPAASTRSSTGSSRSPSRAAARRRSAGRRGRPGGDHSLGPRPRPRRRDRARSRHGATATRGRPRRPFMIAQAACRRRRSPAALPRSPVRVPGSQQLPATGLADVVAALADPCVEGRRPRRPAHRPPAVAVMLANRSASLRAVTGPRCGRPRRRRNRDGRQPARRRSLRSSPVAAWSESARTSTARPPGRRRRNSPPLPAGCGCKSHSH